MKIACGKLSNEFQEFNKIMKEGKTSFGCNKTWREYHEYATSMFTSLVKIDNKREEERIT